MLTKHILWMHITWRVGYTMNVKISTHGVNNTEIEELLTSQWIIFADLVWISLTTIKHNNVCWNNTHVRCSFWHTRKHISHPFRHLIGKAYNTLSHVKMTHHFLPIKCIVMKTPAVDLASKSIALLYSQQTVFLTFLSYIFS